MDVLLIILKYLFLGALQGFTEPIPISSSGHLVIVQQLFGLEIEGLSFEVFVNTASLIAVLIVFREDIKRLIDATVGYTVKKDRSKKNEFRFVVYLVFGTIPAGILGVLLNDYIGEHFKGFTSVGLGLLVTAVALFVIRNFRGRKNDNQMTWKDALLVGIGQAVALIPGISRSGATIVAAMLVGLNKETAFRFSFLLYIPISLGGLVLEIPDLIDTNWTGHLAIAYIVAFIASLVASYYALIWFKHIMERGKLIYFSIYCLFIALIVLFIL